MEKADIIVIGAGIAGLSNACLWAEEGAKVLVLEQNWLPGGCASSYPRKHYVFESGATTLVGLDPSMPLHYLLQKTGIKVETLPLHPPMKVYLKNGTSITRYQNLNQWIKEAERIFGSKNQRSFWTYCAKISEFVWKNALSQKAFPPTNLADLGHTIRAFRPAQIRYAHLAFQSVEQLLKRFGLHENQDFVDFVNEQLLITAQNHAKEVNVLFGATALCYTLYTNYYVPGGLINLVKPMVDYIESKGGILHLRNPVKQIQKTPEGYEVMAKQGSYFAPLLVSAIPINNTLELFDNPALQKKYARKILPSKALNSAFSLGFVVKKRKAIDCLHHQIHLEKPLPYTGSKSFFLSMSHPEDRSRCGPDEWIGSVSCHVMDPQETRIVDKGALEAAIFDRLEELGFMQKSDLIFHHASTPGAWKKWTRRAWGFVGGYPQYMRIKPWQMLDARLDQKGAYICGDSTYPGQGIPGACLSGIIAHQKMKLDGH